MEINLEWYRVFYWTAQTGSLSKAAQRLYISQPAVSHTLKQLESKLGGQLFFRTPRGVTLTAEGQVLFRYLEQAFGLMDVAEKALGEMHGLSRGEINIGASDTLCKYYLLPYLEQFHREHPDIRIRVTNRTTPETLQLLKDGKIDFGLISLPAADKQVEFRQSALLEDCLVGSQQFSSLAREGLTVEELAEHPLLMLEPGANTRSFLDRFAASCGVTLTPEFELGSVDLLVQFAVRGFGLAFVPRIAAAEELAAGRLVEIPLCPSLPERHMGIATLRGIPLPAAAKTFIALLPS